MNKQNTVYSYSGYYLAIKKWSTNTCTTWMKNPRNTMLSERRHHKRLFCRIPFIGNIQKRQIERQSLVSKQWGGEERRIEGDCQKVWEFLLGVIINVLKLFVVMAVQLYEYTKTTELHGLWISQWSAPGEVGSSEKIPANVVWITWLWLVCILKESFSDTIQHGHTFFFNAHIQFIKFWLNSSI